jgi:FG-GAP-like repeat
MQSTKCSRLLAPVACALLIPNLSAALSCAQTPVSFATVTSAGGETPANIYAVDVNNDGLTDIVQDTGDSPSGFAISINQGNGAFGAPTTDTLPGNHSVPNCIAAADYNNDGNIDLAVPLFNTNEIAVYLGTGKGTFSATPIISAINLPSGYVFAVAGCATADFNADGDIDLAAWTADGADQSSGLTELYIFQGEGNGSFNTTPYPVLASGPLQPEQQLFVGDYDSDGKADIAATTSVENFNTGETTSTTIHVLYGNNDFIFDSTTAYTYEGVMSIGSGDLNSDGYTDLFALTRAGTQQLGVFYGNSSRTFDMYWMDTSPTYTVAAAPISWSWQPQLTIADYNGDGYMDLAAMAYNPDSGQYYVESFLSDGNPGEFTAQEEPMSTTYDWETIPLAGLFSGSYLTPDITLNASPNPGGGAPSYLVDFEDTVDSRWFGPCRYPRSGKGFNVCRPGTVTGSTALFSAAADSFGKLRKIELWVDGVKLQEQHHTWDTHAYFDWAGTFSPGTHHAALYASDVDNTLQSYDLTFTISAADTAPNRK